MRSFSYHKPETVDAAVALLDERPSRRRPAPHLRLMNLAPVRRVLAARVRREVSKRARPEHYPAPHALLDLWLRHGGSGQAAFAAEARSVGELIVGRASKNLVRLFLLRERMRNLAPREESVRHVHVVGAGVMESIASKTISDYLAWRATARS